MNIEHEREDYDAKKEKKEYTEKTYRQAKTNASGVDKEVQVPFARHDSRWCLGYYRGLFSISGRKTTNTISSTYRIEKGEYQPSREQTDAITAEVCRQGQESLRGSSRDAGGA